MDYESALTNFDRLLRERMTVLSLLPLEYLPRIHELLRIERETELARAEVDRLKPKAPPPYPAQKWARRWAHVKQFFQ